MYIERPAQSFERRVFHSMESAGGILTECCATSVVALSGICLTSHAWELGPLSA